ncbi:hypothetical protein PIB30_039259 [Stylosanthes scabra]|uniref:KIB1-4 beta-propeller domain-containing protein n=1 Tax=Stylosanthes scabra TaxID=79078 RepID=A0ABU6VFC9_9FABA|nr:hypothetical protein [Stylosanthes scabra]
MAATLVEENTAGNNSRQWSLLGDDILNMITDRFDDIYDYARFGAVCKPWLSFSHRFYYQKQHLFRANHQLPLLVVPMEGHQLIRVSQMDEYGVKKAVLSKDPNEFPNDFEVIAIYGGMKMLAHYKSGDQFWSYPKPTTEIDCFADVIFYKGFAYAVDSHSWIGELLHVRRDYWTLEESMAIDAENEAEERRVQAEYEARTQEEHDQIMERIERESEIQDEEDYEIMISKISEKVYEKPNLSVNFMVFKLDYPFGQKSTETLNGEILFIGDNHSVSVPSSRCPNLSPNSIYYTDDYLGSYSHNLHFGSCDTGLFNIENKSFGKHFVPSFSAKGMPPPIFVVPAIELSYVSQ